MVQACATASKRQAWASAAVLGQGFFEVQLPDGTPGYTRDGSFQVSSTGQLVTNNGYTVQPGITIPANATSVNPADTPPFRATIE